MNHRLLIATACAALAYSTTAYALEGPSGGCEDGGECGTPTPSPPPPPPAIGVSRSAGFFVAPGGNVLQGVTYYPNDVPTLVILNQGPGGTVLTDSPYTQGDGTTQITLITDVANARATAISHIGNEYGRNDVSASLGYGLSFTAGSDAVGDAIAAILAHAPLANVSGSYSISGTETGRAGVSASSYSPFNPGYGFGATCGYYYSNSPACAATETPTAWSMNLQFTRGTEFTGGDRNTFYATFSFNAFTEAGYPGSYPNTYPGDATAWIDPTINYNSQLGQYANGLTFNAPGGLGNGGFSFIGGGAVPEPAQWALMVGGFGMLGGAVRRRRVTFATA